MTLCPGDYSCSVGAEEPRRCRLFSVCPPGSKNENFLVVTSVCLLILGLICWCFMRFYYRLVEHGIGPVVLCAAAVGLMWIIDHVIAGFLSLVFIALAANWALLQLPMRLDPGAEFPSVVSPLLIICTALCSLFALWVLDPPWAMFEGGLFVPMILGWLMSREKLACVVVGRILLLVVLGILILAYADVDPDFIMLVGALLVVIVLILIISWAWEQRRQHRRVSLPFFTRWGGTSCRGMAFADGEQHVEVNAQATESADVRLRLNARDAESGTVPLWRHTEPRQVQSEAAAGKASAGSSQQASKPSKPPRRPSRRLGVSFHLKGVSFDLPDGARLLKDISLGIGRGQRVAVMGPSGSGKSTLLAVLSGRASYGRVSGSLLVAGQPADDLRFLQKVTGFVPQDDVLHGELTAEENIRFQAALRLPAGTTHEDIEDHVARVAKDLNLEGIMKARVGTPELRGVSGGQRKRISIGMELVSRPLLLFADEPTSGLDSTTSHEVVNSLNSAAERLGTTVIAVIHQPRYETLRLFDCLVLLGVGGCLVYSGPTDKAVDHFKNVLQVDFPPNTNPADILLDAIQPPHGTSEVAADMWASRPSVQDEHVDDDEETQSWRSTFKRERVPLIRAVLIYMDRSMLQTIGAASSLLISQVLNIMAVGLLCTILTYETMDQWLMQSAFAVLFLMLLQGVAAQRIFGCDLLITWREARVGMPMVAYFVAKDLAAMVEVTISSVVFTAAYGSLSGMQLTLQTLFAGSWAFIYSVYGLSYISSITLSQGSAQMFAVVISFVAFCVSGVYQPQLNEITMYFNERGWMVPALSPIRWLWAYLLTNEAKFLTPATRMMASSSLRYKGYDLAYIDCPAEKRHQMVTLCEAWKSNRAWVCSVAQMLLLGVMFRCLAVLCLMIRVNAQTSGWGRFFGQSEVGAWKFAGKLFTVLVGTFLGLFLFAEVWIFGIVKIDYTAFR